MVAAEEASTVAEEAQWAAERPRAVVAEASTAAAVVAVDPVPAAAVAHTDRHNRNSLNIGPFGPVAPSLLKSPSQRDATARGLTALHATGTFVICFANRRWSMFPSRRVDQ